VMGITVFAGMLVATFLAVFLVPALFVMIEKMGGKNKHAATSPAPGDAPPAPTSH
jgi:HAE1 family hydrophobic/amphiphilic exporter-1